MSASVHYTDFSSIAAALSQSLQTMRIQQAVDPEVWFPAAAVSACIILFGLILIYILRMGSVVRKPRNSTTPERFSSFFSQTEVGIGVIDADGFIVLSNKALQDLTGYTATQLTTIGFSSLFADRNDYVEPSKVAGMLDKFGESHQVFLRQRNGALVRVRFLVLPSPPAIKDDAEVLLVEAASAEGGGGGDQLPEDDSLQNAKDSFLASLNNDLKTPLTVILGNASILASEKMYCADLVDAILESGQRLLNELDGLLLAQRANSSVGVFLPVAVDSIVLDAVADCSRKAAARNVEIDTTALERFHGSLNHIAFHRLINLLLDVSIDHVRSGRITVSLNQATASFELVLNGSGGHSIQEGMPVESDRRVAIAGSLATHMFAKLGSKSEPGSPAFTIVVPFEPSGLVAVANSIGKAA